MKTGIKATLFRTLVLTALWACAASYAQETESKQPFAPKPTELGVRYSNLTGYGISYQRNFLTNYYIRTTAWFKYYEYIYGKETMPTYRTNNDITYNFGLDLQRNIIREDRYRVAGFIGGGYAVREKTNKSNINGIIVTDANSREQTPKTPG